MTKFHGFLIISMINGSEVIYYYTNYCLLSSCPAILLHVLVIISTAAKSGWRLPGEGRTLRQVVGRLRILIKVLQVFMLR